MTDTYSKGQHKASQIAADDARRVDLLARRDLLTHQRDALAEEITDLDDTLQVLSRAPVAGTTLRVVGE